MDYKQIAESILNHVGGKDNVRSVTHCATRLRFNLYDESKADKAKLDNMDEVIGVIQQGGQYQVVIGNDVKFVHTELNKMKGLETESEQEEIAEAQDDKGIVSKVLDTIAGIFVPIIPVLAGTGLLKALLSVLVLSNLLSPESQTFTILNIMGDAGFFFLPFMIGASAALKFGANQFLSMAIAGILLHPQFTGAVNAAREAGTGITFAGLPVGLANYAFSVIPIILAVWLLSYVESFADRVVPKATRIILSPLLTLLIVAPVTLIVLGPLGVYLGDALGAFVNILDTQVSWLVPTIIGTFSPLLVMTGMHYGIIPIGINGLASVGYETVVGPGMTVSNIAQGGASLAVAIKAKNKKTKQLAYSVWLTAVLGITEPALYGINLRFKRPLVSAMIGGGTAGLYIGIMGVRRYAQVGPGLLALPAFIGPEGWANLINIVIGIIIAFVVSFVVQYVWGIEEVENNPLANPDMQNDAVEAQAKPF